MLQSKYILTDKIKKSSIKTAPKGRMPAIRLLKEPQDHSQCFTCFSYGTTQRKRQVFITVGKEINMLTIFTRV